MSKDPNYPARKWDPVTGESQVFTAPEDVPTGWLDTHPNNVKAADKVEAPVSDALPMTRAEIRAELDQAGIPYPKTAKTEMLYVLLGDSLKQHLTKSGIAYEPDASVPALLELVKPAE